MDITKALLLNYFKIALRKIKRQKGYTIINVSGMVWMQNWEFSKWILLSGVIAGPLVYWSAKNWLSGFAYHFNPGIGILLVTVLVTLVIAMLTVGYQSLKAAMANPVDSLRHD